jgi:hypothetical protein
MDRIIPMPLTLAGPPGGLTHAHPVGRLVTGAPEAIRLHEGLQQVKGMVVASLPVRRDPPGNLRQKMRG